MRDGDDREVKFNSRLERKNYIENKKSQLYFIHTLAILFTIFVIAMIAIAYMHELDKIQ